MGEIRGASGDVEQAQARAARRTSRCRDEHDEHLRAQARLGAQRVVERRVPEHVLGVHVDARLLEQEVGGGCALAADGDVQRRPPVVVVRVEVAAAADEPREVDGVVAQHRVVQLDRHVEVAEVAARGDERVRARVAARAHGFLQGRHAEMVPARAGKPGRGTRRAHAQKVRGVPDERVGPSLSPRSARRESAQRTRIRVGARSHLRLGLAPLCRRYSTFARWPSAAATCSAVRRCTVCALRLPP